MPTKPKRALRAHDIKPNTLYMVTGIGPCTFLCSEEPGYLRGHVMLEYDPMFATATAIDAVRGRAVHISMLRDNDGWYFSHISRAVSELPANWIDEQLQAYKADRDRVNATISRLEELKEKYKVPVDV